MKRALVSLTVRLSSARCSDPARAPLPPTLSTRSFNWQFLCARTDAAERCSSCLRVLSCGGGGSFGQALSPWGPPSLDWGERCGKGGADREGRAAGGGAGGGGGWGGGVSR